VSTKNTIRFDLLTWVYSFSKNGGDMISWGDKVLSCSVYCIKAIVVGDCMVAVYNGGSI